MPNDWKFLIYLRQGIALGTSMQQCERLAVFLMP